MDKESKWHHILTENWQSRLTSFFTLLFLLQFVSWISLENNVWWPETVTIVKISLFTTFALELLPRMNVWMLRCIQVWILLAANAMFSSYKPVWYKVRSLGDISNWIYDNFWQLHPFVWFSLGAWLVYLAASWWLRVRWRIGVATVLAVIALASRDSFSLLHLWKETAIVIFCGLMLLVVCHFSEIKRLNPTGWIYLVEYPATVLVTICVLLGATMIPGTMAPNIRPLVTDPYTAYLHWKGREAPTFGKSFWDNNLLPTGNASSGYSRDDSSLGGGFDFDYSPVFTVDTTHRSYWRGETRSNYTGDGWQMSDSDKQAASGQVGLDNALGKDSRFNTSLLKTVKVQQTVEVLGESPSYPVLFGAFSISKVVSINGEKTGSDKLRWAPRQSELRWNEAGRGAYPSSYVIESEMPVVSGEELKAAVGLPDVNQFSDYLQLPKGLPARVRQLAQEISAKGTTAYEKAKLLEQYLQMNFPYTSQPREEWGKSDDFVDRFLFEIREGYCDYFSSAMAVMSRTLGIPTRWVKGYVSGYNQYDDASFIQVPLDIMENPDGQGTYTVRNADAHSWVELYFHGYGWIPFEATSGFSLPVVVQEEASEPFVLPDFTPDAVTPTESVESESKGLNKTLIIVIMSAGGLAFAVLLAGWIFRSRLPAILFRGRFITGKRAINPRQRVVAEYSRLVKHSRRRGVQVYEHETARETIGRLKHRHRWMTEDLDQLLVLFEKAKYSTRSVTHEECGQVIEIVDKLKKAI